MYKVISKFNGNGTVDIYDVKTAETFVQAMSLYADAVDRFLTDFSESFGISLAGLFANKEGDEYSYRRGIKMFTFVSYDGLDRCVTTIRIAKS